MKSKKILGFREKVIIIGCLLILSLLCVTKYICWLLDVLDSLKNENAELSLKSWFSVYTGVSIFLAIVGVIFAILPFFSFVFKDIEIGKKILILVNIVIVFAFFAVVALYISALDDSSLNGVLMMTYIDNSNIQAILFSLCINSIMQYMCLSVYGDVYNDNKPAN